MPNHRKSQKLTKLGCIITDILAHIPLQFGPLEPFPCMRRRPFSSPSCPTLTGLENGHGAAAKVQVNSRRGRETNCEVAKSLSGVSRELREDYHFFDVFCYVHKPEAGFCCRFHICILIHPIECSDIIRKT